MIGIIATLVVFGILVTMHEWGHFIVAKRQGVAVERFSIGFGPVLIRYTWHETEYAISLIPLGGYVKMAGDEPDPEKIKGESWEFLSKTPWQKIKIAFAGPVVNYIFALFIFIFVFLVGFPAYTTKIGDFVEGYPAKASGLALGDKITKVNGISVEMWDDLIYELNKLEKTEVVLEYTRGTDVKEIKIDTKKEDRTDIFGKKTTAYLLGIRPAEEMISKKYGVFQAVSLGTKKLLNLSILTYKSIWMIATGQMSLKKSITGPIGIAMITGKTAKSGLIHLIHLMGLLSAALALFNFLPIPVLDGGHVVFYLFELITGKQLSLKFQDVCLKIGMGLLITLMVVVFYNDIVNFGLWGKIVGLARR